MELEFTIYPKESLLIVFPHLTKTNLSGIYFFFGEDGELIYIGKAKHLYQRLHTHLNSHYDNIWDFKKEIHFFSFIPLDDYTSARSVEKELILKYQPRLNAVHNKGTFRLEEAHKKRLAESDRYARSRGFKTMQEMIDDAMEDFSL